MNEQAMHDVETRLAAWLATRAPAEVPVSLITRVATIPTASPTRGPVLRRLGLPFGRAAGRPVRAGLLAAAIVVAVGGALIVAMTVDRSGPIATPVPASPVPASGAPESPAPVSPSPSAPPSAAPLPTSASSEPFRGGGMLPATMPDGVSHGIVDTPIGRVRWAHLEGDATTLPDPLVPVRGPGESLVWFWRGGPTDICYNGGEDRPECIDPPGPRLEVSPDLLAPREARPLPVTDGTASLWESGGWFWLMAADPAGVWRSRDLATWEPTDLSGIASPGPAGVGWTLSPTWVAASDGATVGQFTFSPVDLGRLLGYPGQEVHLRPGDAGSYVVQEHHSRRDGGDVDLGTITVSEAEGGIRFADETGREVGSLDGVGLEFVDAWASGIPAYDVFARLEGDRWTPIEAPGLPLGATFGGSSSLVDVDGAVFVFSVSPDTRVRGWRSTDGRVWTGGEVITDATGTPLRGGSVWYRDEGDVRAIVVGRDDGGNGWVSTDGERFVPDTPPEDPVLPTRFSTGQIRTGDQTADGSWLVSRDGSTWEEATALARIITRLAPDGAGGTSKSALDNVVFFSVDEMDGPRELWILEFEEPEG